MAKLIRSNAKDNKILSVVLLMTTDKEKKIYKSFLDGEMTLSKCEHCGQKIDRSKISEYYLIIYNPLSGNPLGFPTGDPVIKCPHCGKPIKLSMMDITPFTAITTWLKQQREKAKAKAKKG